MATHYFGLYEAPMIFFFPLTEIIMKDPLDYKLAL